MDAGLLCMGILAGAFVGFLPVLIRWQPGDGAILARSIREDIEGLKQSIELPTTDNYVDPADIQAHRQAARNSPEPYRTQSRNWLNNNGIDW